MRPTLVALVVLAGAAAAPAADLKVVADFPGGSARVVCPTGCSDATGCTGVGACDTC